MPYQASLEEEFIASPLRIPNRQARRLLLAAQGLNKTPTGAIDLKQMIERLGFVQLDSIQVVARAHHHILWSRNQNYREPMLDRHMADERQVFEHFTHDASVIPIDFYPMWQRQFRRLEEKVQSWGWDRAKSAGVDLRSIKRRIRQEGPLSTKDFSTKLVGEKSMWSRPPHKLALDYLWYAGELSTAHRINFTKFYDLTERVIPETHRQRSIADQDQIRWLCDAALRRLVFGTTGDIQRFWDAVDSAEVGAWVKEKASRLMPVDIQGADKSWRRAWAFEDVEQQLAQVPTPTSRLRILNPFDPLIRDRQRLKHLFGFDYTVEMFVPAAKRKWGYYVYPILEGDRFVGRIEVKATRKSGTLEVMNLWSESKINWTTARAEKLAAELLRLGRLSNTPEIVWSCRRAPSPCP
ncbi:MAG: crosslink repair DNA glycosylase YcaQ family protein [Pseudomonadota bacterium]